MKKRHVIGWRERIDLPEWEIEGILAKSDTGALSSAIDVASIEELPGNRVRFEVRLSRKNPERRVSVESEISRRVRIRSSNGAATDRLLVMTIMQVGGIRKEVELGLVCRKSMLCRVLLGRRALEGDFLVDCTTKHMLRAGTKEQGPGNGEAKT